MALKPIVPQRTLYDVRDANAYTIRKLADGNCWMTENLRLINKTLTPDDSNVTSNWTLPDTASGTNDDTAYVYVDTTYGGYYSWYAATAGAGTTSVSSGNVSTSICPKGWKLPSTNGSSTDFQTLYNNYNSASKMQATDGPAFVLSGRRAGSSTGAQGSFGLYWSSTAYDSSNAYYLRLNSSDVYPASTTYKYYGFSVRCVADDSTPGTLTVTPDSIDADTATTVDVSIPLSGDYTASISLGSTALTCSRTSTSPLSFSCSVPSTTSGTYTLTASLPSYGKTYSGSLTVKTPAYMQDQTNINTCKSAATGTTFTLTDSRDNEEYKVRKLADGKCWMVENLRLQNKTISNADSNLPSDKTVEIPASSNDKWCKENSTDCDDQLMTLDATDKNIPNQGSADPTWGVYYNWYTATATYGTYSKTSGSVSYDICPKGWRLPTGYSGEFQTLYGYYGSSADMRSATGPAFVLSGIREGDSTQGQGSAGYYWSSTADGIFYAYDLLLDSSYVFPANNNNKFYGFSVRCVAQ